MIFPRRHLTTRHGTNTTLFSFTVMHLLSLSEDVPLSTPTAPTTLLRVVNVSKEILAGTVLEFKPVKAIACDVIRFTTVGVTALGSTTISIEPYTGSKVPCGLIAKNGPVDLTGRVYRGQVKRQLADDVPLLTLACSIEPLAGTVSVACDTTALPFSDANCDFLELPENNAEFLAIDAVDKKTGRLLLPRYSGIIKKSYFWDLEYTLNGNGPIPSYTGRFWIQREATV
jgi:hypothetical protein